MKDIGYDVLMWALGLLGTIITTIILPYIVSLLKAKTKNEKLQYVINELGEAVTTSVDYVYQTFVEQMKKDGTFDFEAQQEALARASEYALNTLSENAKKIMSSEGIDINSIILKYIESTIAQQKK